ncbi:MAG: D-allose transport system permease protein AlsC [Firmicutes bacterium]|nr:D-allose transport system permease protein AlsC [Bacillota bacterium]
MADKERKASGLREILVPLGATGLGLVVGAVIIMTIGENPLRAYAALFYGAFGSLDRILGTLTRATPIIITGLAVALPFKAGLFNIGVEGQMLMGALAAAVVGSSFRGLPMLVHLPLAIVAAMVGGGLWAFIPAWLKARRGIHEVINTIMMNFIANAVLAYLVVEVLRTPGEMIPKTPPILSSAVLARFGDSIPGITARLNMGFVLALLAAVALYYLLWRTTTGYEIRAVGLNPKAAEYAGIDVPRRIMLAMVLSGLLAGLAGAERILGFGRTLFLGFSPGFGFEGIAVALLGRNHPVGILLAALLFGALSSGGMRLSFATDVPSDIIVVLQATIIFFVAADQIVRAIIFPKKKGVA